MTWQLAEDDVDLQCPHCSAYYTNEAALWVHVKKCQARIGHDPIKESEDD